MTEMPSELLLEAVVLINAAKRFDKPDMAIVQVIIFLRPIWSIQIVHRIAPGTQKSDESNVSK
jgi:hypothetical protein